MDPWTAFLSGMLGAFVGTVMGQIAGMALTMRAYLTRSEAIMIARELKRLRDIVES